MPGGVGLRPWACVTLFRMSGSRNGRPRQSWPPTAARLKKLIRELRAETTRSAPRAVREAVNRVSDSVRHNTRPDVEDLALVVMWLLEQRARRRQRRKVPKKDLGWASRSRATPPSSPPAAEVPASPEPSAPPAETAFAQQMEKQESTSAGRVRRRLGVQRSRVRSDAQGRRTIIRGDSKDG